MEEEEGERDRERGVGGNTGEKRMGRGVRIMETRRERERQKGKRGDERKGG